MTNGMSFQPRHTSSDKDYAYFEAVTPGFSTFAIGVDSTYVAPEEDSSGETTTAAASDTETTADTETIESMDTSETESQEGDDSKQKSPLLGLIVAIILVLAVTAGFVYFKNREHY